MVATLGRLMKQPLQVRSKTGSATDPYGNDTRAWGAPVAVLGYLEWQASDEALVDRDTVRTQWVAYLPPGTVIAAADQVINGSQTLEVMGQPEQVWNPRVGAVSHVVVRLSEVEQ